MTKLPKDAEHPIQPVVRDGHGVVRFKRNAIVEHLLTNSVIDMNTIARLTFDRRDREQFAQLIGYSVAGFGDLDYVRPDTLAAAERMAETGETAEQARIATLQSELDAIREESASVKKPVPDAECNRCNDLAKQLDASREADQANLSNSLEWKRQRDEARAERAAAVKRASEAEANLASEKRSHEMTWNAWGRELGKAAGGFIPNRVDRVRMVLTTRKLGEDLAAARAELAQLKGEANRVAVRELEALDQDTRVEERAGRGLYKWARKAIRARIAALTAAPESNGAVESVTDAMREAARHCTGEMFGEAAAVKPKGNLIATTSVSCPKCGANVSAEIREAVEVKPAPTPAEPKQSVDAPPASDWRPRLHDELARCSSPELDAMMTICDRIFDYETRIAALEAEVARLRSEVRR